MLLSQPASDEQALDVLEALVRSGQCALVIVDSVSAFVSEAHPALQARLMSRAMRKLASLADQTGTTLLFLSGPDADLAGNALKFYASVRIHVRPKDLLIVKNKLAPPFQVCVYEVSDGLVP
jgi:recombination protein RecA